MPIVLARHGETEWSANGRHTGRTDLPLTDAGRREADQVGAAVHRILTERSLTTAGPPLVLVSPRARARDTAARAGLDPVVVDPDVVEWDYGDYEGRTTPDIHTEVPDWSIWTHGAPGGESVADVEARADGVIDRIAGPEADGVVIIVAHGHFLRMLGARWLGQPGRFGERLLFGTASVSVLAVEREVRAIECWNDRHHLTG